MITQKMIDDRDFYSFPNQKWERLLAMKNKFYPKLKQGEFIRNDQIIIAMRRKLAEEQGKAVEVVEVQAKVAGRTMKMVRKIILTFVGCGCIYFLVSVLAWAVRP